MQYMVIEKFIPGKIKDLYRRFDKKGRMLPPGVVYINSWINEQVTVCYQVMECDSPDQLQLWMDRWNDLVDFEVVAVISSAEAEKRVFSKD